ncbi:MAG: DUF2062 domain-containing protein [Pirellulales bacterium]
MTSEQKLHKGCGLFTLKKWCRVELMGLTIFGLLQISSRHNRPKQIAWAIVWGCICGVLPKSSLLFFLASAASLLMPMHLVVAAITLVATSLFSPIIQPFFGNLGHWILSTSGIAGPIRSLDKFPLLPWLNLHNTVLIGAVTFNIGSALPAYWMAVKFLSMFHSKWMPMYDAAEQLIQASMANDEQSILTKVEKPSQREIPSNEVRPTLSPPAIAAQFGTTATVRPPMVAPEVEPQPLAAALNRFDESMSSFTASQRRGSSQQVSSSVSDVIDSIHALEDLLEKAHAEADQPIDAKAVLARATQASELVDDILASMDAESETNLNSDVRAEATLVFSHNQSPNQPRLDSAQVFQSHDTKISIYRRARTGEFTVTGSDAKTHSEKDSMPTATDEAEQQSNLAVAKSTSKSVLARTPVVGHPTEPSTIRKHDNQQQEEALRHLLNHLRALKEKV